MSAFTWQARAPRVQHSARSGTRVGALVRPCLSAGTRRAAAAPASRRSSVAVHALFSFLAPPTPAAPKVDPRAREIAEQLINVASGGSGGAAQQEAVAEVVSELARYCPKNPLRSPLLWGTWEVVYCSKPTAVGGPLKKGAGPVLFPGQRATQTLEEPNTLVNEVTYSTLGFLPGYSRQYGEIQPLSGDTFLLTIRRGELNAGLGGTQEKEFDIQRKIQLVYLDEELRIQRFLPSEDLADSEAEGEQGGPESEEILFVFRRVADQEEEVVVEEEVEEEEEEAPAPVLKLPFGGTRKVESLATQAERRVRQQLQAQGGDSAEVEVVQPAKGGTGIFGFGGTRPIRAVPSRQQQVVEEEEAEEEETPAQRRARERREALAARAAEAEARKAEAAKVKAAAEAAKAKEREAEERRRSAEEAKAAKAREAEEKRKAAEEARARAEQEKVARAERQAAIKELLADLSEQLREVQAAAKEALGEFKNLQREAVPVTKAGAAAQQAVARAESEVAEVAQALAEAGEERKAAEAAAKQAAAALKEAEAAARKKVLTIGR